MNNILEYKGYYTKIEFDSDSNILCGKIEGISDLITFEASSASQVALEFHKAVNDYLDFCADVGKSPDKTYKGSFNIRISPDLHKKAAVSAFKENISLNQFVEKAISNFLSKDNLKN